MSRRATLIYIVRGLSLVIIAATVLVLLHQAKIPAENLWIKTFLNTVHVFVFAAVALLLFAATKAIPNLYTTHRALIVLLTALILGVVSEAAQISGPRDASWEDVASNWMGAIGALLIGVTFKSKAPVNRKSRVILIMTGLAVLILAISPLLVVSAAYAERYYQKPILVSFDSFFARTFVRQRYSTLMVAKSPSGDEVVGRVSLTGGAWPGLVIHDVWPDWSPYSELVIALSLEAGEPLPIHFSVHDRHHQIGEQPYNDRFNLSHELPPGRHTLRIPLETIKHAPAGRQMDLSDIAGIVIFCSKKEAGREFGLVSIRLQ